MQMSDVRAGIIGASGYTGAELMRLIGGHLGIELAGVTADSMAGRAVADLYPSLGAPYPDLRYATVAELDLDALDVVFLGLPHEASATLVPELLATVPCVVDLSAAFRLHDPAHYPAYYGFEHAHPALLAEAVFGLPEVHRERLRTARLIATPGCHVTATVLALRPLVAAGLVEPAGIVVDTLTGVTGAGRVPTDTNVFANIDANATAYGLVGHRHTPEMEQEIGAELIFTPHLVPMSRGLLATCTGRAAPDCSTTQVLGALREAYDGEPFVTVSVAPPATKSVLGSNMAVVSAVHDPRTGTVIAMCAIDNLTKGASGGALQSANVALGLTETDGLPRTGLAP